MADPYSNIYGLLVFQLVLKQFYIHPQRLLKVLAFGVILKDSNTVIL
jgi:hypothetical protein